MQTLDNKLDSQVEKILGKKHRGSPKDFGSSQLDPINDPVQADFEETQLRLLEPSGEDAGAAAPQLKQTPTSYFLFLTEHNDRVRLEHPDKTRLERCVILGRIWKTEMSPEDILKYKMLAAYMKENPIEGVPMTTKEGVQIYRRTMMEKLGEREPQKGMEIDCASE